MTALKLGPAEIALMEAHPQATIDFLTRLALADVKGHVPLAAIEALQRIIEDRFAHRQPGYVLMRIDVGPTKDRAIRWRVIDGERVLASGIDDRIVA